MTRGILRRTLPLALASLTFACNPVVFDRLRESASTRAVEAPSGYAAERFGRTLATIESPGSSGERRTLLAVGGGVGYPVEIIIGWTGSGFHLDGALFEVCSSSAEGCIGDDGVTNVYGEAVAGVPRWRAGTPSEGTGCFLVTSTATGGFGVRCESVGATERIAGARPGIQLGATAASLGAGNDVGVAVLGAPGDASGAGGLYRVPDGSGAAPIAIDAGLVPGGALGSALAAAPLDPTRALVVASAPAAGRVLVLTVRADGTGEALACLDDPTPGFGRAVAIGDVDGDGAKDVIVGGVPPDESSATVQIYLGSATPAPGCGGWGAAPIVLGCPADARGVGCNGSAFGAAVAAGDVDGDGDDEVLVGAPRAVVEGVESAGALYVFAGGPAGPSTASVVVQTHSRPSAGSRLGTTAAALPSGLGVGLTPRAEPVGGAPGTNEAMVFTCTGLPGDTWAELGDQCVPTR